MKKIARRIIGTTFIACGVGILVFSVSLLTHMNGWGEILSLFVPIVLLGIVIVFIGWGILDGMRWRDVVELIVLLWQ
jgi:hypothetical protein